jgi:hypothetical protein
MQEKHQCKKSGTNKKTTTPMQKECQHENDSNKNAKKILKNTTHFDIYF